MSPQTAQEFSLGLRCGQLLTMKGGLPEILKDQFLGIIGGKIEVIAPWGQGLWRAREWIWAENKVVMPGLVNAHTHLAMSPFRGLADDEPFAQWLHGPILPLEAGLVDAEFVRVGTELALLE